VSSQTPAAHLARLQVTWPAWRITRDIPEVTGSRGFTAVERATGRRIIAATVGELEATLMDADGSKGGTP
jgi:hypothetical protein